MLSHQYAEPKQPVRVVVLGAKGFLGKALTERLERGSVAVRAIGSATIDLASEGAGQRLAAELKSNDTLVFLSALTPDKGRGIPPFLANLKMAEAVCTAIERQPVGHLVYISSDAVYPFQAGLIDESSAAEPVDLYGTMHLAREIMVKQAGKTPVAVLRPTLIYGAADTHNSYGPNRLRRMARKDKRMALFGQGEETRDHVYIDDVVALIELAVRHRSTGMLNLASGRSISYAELAKLVAKQFSERIEIAGSPRQNPITHRAFDITAIHRAFPAFAFTPLERGLEQAHHGEAA